MAGISRKAFHPSTRDDQALGQVVGTAI